MSHWSGLMALLRPVRFDGAGGGGAATTGAGGPASGITGAGGSLPAGVAFWRTSDGDMRMSGAVICGAAVVSNPAGRPFTASTMYCANMRAGALPPCRPGTGLASSLPTQTPVVRPDENPRNHPSLLELVVPVLPATGRSIAAAREVPLSTDPRIIAVMLAATCSVTTICGCGVSCR